MDRGRPYNKKESFLRAHIGVKSMKKIYSILISVVLVFSMFYM